MNRVGFLFRHGRASSRPSTSSFAAKTWMRGTNPGMTSYMESRRLRRGLSHPRRSAKARRNPRMSGSSMIPRYTRPEIASIWEAQTRFKIWFEIEAHAADAQAELGVIPKEAAKTIWAKAKNGSFDIARIDEIERETKHDVIAFTTHLAEIVGPEARFVHQGMTSSNVLDTCFNVQLTRAADILI